MSFWKNPPFGRSPRLLIVVYVLLVLCLTILDQTTKLHAEKAFLEWFHPAEVHQMSTGRHRVFAWGVPPSLAFETGSKTPATPTSNWLDFNLTYVRNTGAAWGALGNLPKAIRSPFFLGVTLLALGVVSWLFWTSHPGQRFYRMGLCFIFAGAIGNFVDRIALGYVIDWLHFHWKVFGWEYSFPVFNVADVCINVGVGAILLDLLIGEIMMKKMKLLPNSAA